MKIVVGSDHRGFDAKRRLITFLQSMGHEVSDVGTQSSKSVDYPDFAIQASEMVSVGHVERAVLLCGTSLGMCIAANKVRGVRATPCHDSITAEMSRRHNDANVLCLSADLLGAELMDRMVKLWLETPFEGGRHARRVAKIMEYERIRPPAG